MENLVVAFIILIAVFICIQVGVMIGAFLAIRKIGDHVNVVRTNLDQNVTPAIVEIRETFAEAKEVLRNLHGVAENLKAASETVRYHVERVNSVIEETTDRARQQISRADEVVTDAIEKMEVTANLVQQSVLVPVRELSALLRGVSGGLTFLFGRKRNQVDEVHQDEEMFI